MKKILSPVRALGQWGINRVGVLLGLAALVVAPVFLSGLPCSDDTLPHFFRAVQLDVNVRSGAPFLQWGTDLMRGYGYPIFAFYAPLTYWLIEVIHWLGADFGLALQLTFFSAILLAGWGAYTFARHYLTVPGAFVAGLAYLFAPYLLYDAIQRGALPESLALALLPWALAAAADAQIKRTPRAIALTAAAFSILILAHNVVPVFGLGMALALSVIPNDSFSTPVRGWWLRGCAVVRGMWPTVAALLLALGLTAFFWLPVLADLQYTQSRRPDPPFHDWPRFEQHILPLAALVEWPADPADPHLLNPPVSRTLGAGQAVFALIGLGLLPRYGLPKRGWRLFILGAMTLGCLFFASVLSRWWWWNLDALNFIQLPTRFLGPASLGLAVLSGLAVDQLTHISRVKFGQSILIAVPALAVSISGWPWLYPLYCPVPEHPTRVTLAHSTVWSRWYAEAQGEVLPRWVDTLPPQDALISQYDAQQPVNRLLMPDGVEMVAWDSSPGRDCYTLVLSNPATVIYRTFYFPGWRAVLDGDPIPIRVAPGEGLMALDLPAGSHTVEIAFQRTPIRRITLIASSVAVLIVLPLWAIPRTTSAITTHRSPSDPHFTTLTLIVFVLLACKFGLADRIPSPIRADRFREGRLSGLSTPAAVDFSGEVTCLGYTGPAQVKPGASFLLTQYWTAQHSIGVPYWFAVRVADEAGNVWNLPPQRPFGFAFYPGTDRWLPGNYARDAYRIQLLPGTPPGEYWLEASAFRRDVDLALIPVGVPTSLDPSLARVGKIVVIPATTKLGPQDAAVDTYSPRILYPLSGLTLIGWSIPEGTLISGDFAHVELLWTTPANLPGADRVATLGLLDARGNTVAGHVLTIGGARYPTSQWGPGAVVRDQINWRIPPALASGAYAITAGIAETETISLGSLTVVAPARTFTPPAVAVEVNAAFGFARLDGFTLSSASAAPGETVVLDLLWQAVEETETSYRVFTHVRDAIGSVRAQSDSVPAEWTRPTTGWLPGEFILDRHALSIPSDLPAGKYELFVGLCDAATGERIGEVLIAEIQVR